MRNIVFIPLPIDEPIIKDYSLQFDQKSDQKIVDNYNKQEAFFGVRQQMRYAYALHLEFLKRFGKSPLATDSDYVFSLNGKIFLTQNSWEFISKN